MSLRPKPKANPTMTEIITLAGLGETSLTTTDAARAERDGLLAMAKTIVVVTDPEAAKSAATAMRSLTDFTRQIESARSVVKAPVLDLGKRIDGLARELTMDLQVETDRIGKVLGTWQAEQRRLEEEAQRKAREEEQRIWREAKAKEEAERARIRKEEEAKAAKLRAELAELEAKAARARSDAGREKAAQEAEARKIQAQIEADQRQAQQEEEAKKRDEEAGRAMVAARVQGNQVVASKPTGVATRLDIKYEITDIKALYAAMPYCVTLSENTLILKDALKKLKEGEAIPGVRHWKEAKTHVR